MPDVPLPLLDPVDTGSGYALDIDYYLKHDYSDIGEAMEKLPAIIEYVNSQLQNLTEQKICQKQAIKRAEAFAFFRLRQGAFEDQYDGKATDSAVERATALEADVTVAHEKYAVLAGWTSRLYNLMNSLQLKLDMIRSTEATRRKDLESGDDDESDSR